jgi:hypothetical protein
MAGFGASQYLPMVQQLTARLRRLIPMSTGPAANAAPADDDRSAKPFKPRGRTHYSDETTTVIGRTLMSPNGMFRLADLDRVRPVPVVEPRERAKDATAVSVFAVVLLATVVAVTYATYELMAAKFGDTSLGAFLGTAIVSAVILAGYVTVVLARWRVHYDRDPVRYRHVIVAVHRGESVAITPEMPYETADQIVSVLDKVKRTIPKRQDRLRRQAAA